MILQIALKTLAPLHLCVLALKFPVFRKSYSGIKSNLPANPAHCQNRPE